MFSLMQEKEIIYCKNTVHGWEKAFTVNRTIESYL
jgi:hypothetical protein